MSFLADGTVERSLTPAELGRAHGWLVSACRQWLLPDAGEDRGVLTEPAEPDWDVIKPMAFRHGVEPILHALDRRGSPHVRAAPDVLRQGWERAYYSTRIHNSEALDLLAIVGERARRAGIPIAVLKGPAVMAAVYRDVGLRPMADLDLWCRARDLRVLADVARSLGFGRTGQPYLHHLVFVRAQDRKILELHFDAHYPVRNKSVFVESAWADCTDASVEDWSFPVMSEERQIVLELAHDAFHGFDLALKHGVDFAGRLLRRREVRRRRVLQDLLDAVGLEDEFALFVAALERLMGIALPGGTAGEPSAPAAGFANAMLERSRSFGFERRQKTAVLYLRQRGLRKRAVFVWKRLVPPVAALQAAYGTRSPAIAIARLPVHIGRTLLEVAARAKRGV